MRVRRTKDYLMRYQQYVLGAAFFVSIFVVWLGGVLCGFTSVSSLLCGVLLFFMLSAGYAYLLFRGASRHYDLETLLREDADQAVLNADAQNRSEASLLRDRLLHSIERLRAQAPNGKNVKDALYQLPWYLVIGEPASGKSTMIDQSGLTFPYAERERVQTSVPRITPDCDWLFSTEAVLLDTAGRYMNNEVEAVKWRGFLRLLRKHRQRRPLNGLIVAVSVQDILQSAPADLERKAKKMRERIQETHELLELRLPIYLVLTKVDLVPGFSQFFDQLGALNTGEVMGRTFSHMGFEASDWGSKFGDAMGELMEYWQETADRQLVQQDIQVTRKDSAMYRFPLELAAIKPVLQRFVEHLLQANPYQPSALLRGFYFTSAVNAGASEVGEHSGKVTQRFALADDLVSADNKTHSSPVFINGLFRKVIFPDQYLVGQYSGSRRELRTKAKRVGIACTVAVLICVMWGWSFWSNKLAIERVAQDLTTGISEDQSLEGQYTGWHTLDRLRSWTSNYYDLHHGSGIPLHMRLGLYQGHDIEPFLRQHYFSRLETIMLKPTAQNLTRSLHLLTTIKIYQRNARELTSVTGVDSVEPRALPVDNRPASVADFGKSTLETYLMLSRAQREKADPAYLKAHLPDYWYPAISQSVESEAFSAKGIRESEDYLYAGHQIDFYSNQIHEPDVPLILNNAFLVSSSRNYINSLLSRSLRAIETITLESDTLFAFGRADFQSLKEEGQRQLSTIAGKLLNTPNVGKIVISGHADQLGDLHSNLQVSRQRAQTIKTYLVGKGLAAELVDVMGVGSAKPLVRCNGQLPRAELIECLEPNRRVEIEVRALN